MAETSGTSFEDLNHSGLIKATSKDDKNVAFSLDIFRGNTKFTIFPGQGAKPWSFTLSPKIQAGLVVLFTKMYNNVRVCSQAINLRDWVEENGRFTSKPVGQIRIGIDETMTVFFDFQHKDLPNRFMFPIKADTKVDFSETDLTEADLVQAILKYLINTLSYKVPVAEALTSFKRQGGGNRGGGNFNRGGGGGGNRGGYNNGGGYNNNRGGGGGGSFSGGNQSQGGHDVESDIHV